MTAPPTSSSSSDRQRDRPQPRERPGPQRLVVDLGVDEAAGCDRSDDRLAIRLIADHRQIAFTQLDPPEAAEMANTEVSIAQGPESGLRAIDLRQRVRIDRGAVGQ